jgi:ankyrin repeat protein
VKLLLDSGSDIALRDEDEKTALDYAKKKGQKEAMTLLENAQ